MDVSTESGRIHPLGAHIQSVSVHEMLFPTQCLLLMFMLAGAGQYLRLYGEIPLAEAEVGHGFEERGVLAEANVALPEWPLAFSAEWWCWKQ